MSDQALTAGGQRTPMTSRATSGAVAITVTGSETKEAIAIDIDCALVHRSFCDSGIRDKPARPPNTTIAMMGLAHSCLLRLISKRPQEAAHHPTRCLQFKVEGPVVARMQAVSMDNWIKASGYVLHGETYFAELKGRRSRSGRSSAARLQAAARACI